MSHEPVKERQINIMKAGGATRGPIVMDWDMLKMCIRDRHWSGRENWRDGFWLGKRSGRGG